MSRETKLTSFLVAAGRKKCNAEILNLHGHAMQEPGWPDVYISQRYYRGWIEFKDRNTVVEKHQKRKIAKLRSNGDNVLIARFLEQKGSFWKIRVQDEEGRVFFILRIDGSHVDVFLALIKACHEACLLLKS